MGKSCGGFPSNEHADTKKIDSHNRPNYTETVKTATTITLPTKETERLKTAALRYGISTDELSRRIIAEATRSLLEIPEESLDEYDNPEEILRAFKQAILDERRGKILRTLPTKKRRRR